MKNLFELPELFTLDGTVFGSGIPDPAKDWPNRCTGGCDKGCDPGGCFPGSKAREL